MKKHIPLTVVAVAVVAVVLGYFLYDRSRPECDVLFEQTATRLAGSLHLVKTWGDLIIGREKAQEVDKSNQKFALDLQSCCIAQQSGHMKPEAYQGCIDGARNFATNIERVANDMRMKL